MKLSAVSEYFAIPRLDHCYRISMTYRFTSGKLWHVVVQRLGWDAMGDPTWSSVDRGTFLHSRKEADKTALDLYETFVL